VSKFTLEVVIVQLLPTVNQQPWSNRAIGPLTFLFCFSPGSLLSYEVMKLRKWSLLLLGLVFLVSGSLAKANAGSVLGVHILDTEEIDQAKQVAKAPKEGDWGYVTVPIRIDQLQADKWQKFFDKAYESKLIPLVRLATKFEDGKWLKPTKADIIALADFLSSVDWHSTPRFVIVFNEPNHANEWGGQVDPEGYADVLEFTADWFHTEGKNFYVLPAGLDAEAPNGWASMESMNFLGRMINSNPDLMTMIDAWTSHSYPNPGFSASAYKTGKNSLWGWKYELEYIKKRTGVDLDVYITETGWDQNKIRPGNLFAYYDYAFSHIWNDSRVKAVTPFVLNGNNGIFEGFSLYRNNGTPTVQLEALLRAKESASRNN
jgi:hypothetical protein